MGEGVAQRAHAEPLPLYACDDSLEKVITKKANREHQALAYKCITRRLPQARELFAMTALPDVSLRRLPFSCSRKALQKKMHAAYFVTLFSRFRVAIISTAAPERRGLCGG